MYQLTHNYRSHAGILSLASAILDLLVEFFPESFDRLEKDQGMFDGPPPVVLESGSAADLAILLSGNKRKTSHIEFGAHQVGSVCVCVCVSVYVCVCKCYIRLADLLNIIGLNITMF